MFRALTVESDRILKIFISFGPGGKPVLLFSPSLFFLLRRGRVLSGV